MARSPKQPDPRNAQLSAADKKAAIVKIDRRILDIDTFDVASISNRSDPTIGALSSKLDDLLMTIFGACTFEYSRYRPKVIHLCMAPMNSRYATPAHEIQKALRHGLAGAKSQLEAIRAIFIEDLQDGEPDTSESEAPMLNRLHPAIVKKCEKLFQDRHYGEAVEKSFKTVRDELRNLTGYEKGSEAFGKGRLHIDGAAASHVDADFNEGAKFLMMAIDMFRNEKSHSSDANIKDPIRALHYLTLSSLAMYFLDKASVRSP